MQQICPEYKEHGRQIHGNAECAARRGWRLLLTHWAVIARSFDRSGSTQACPYFITLINFLSDIHAVAINPLVFLCNRITEQAMTDEDVVTAALVSDSYEVVTLSDRLQWTGVGCGFGLSEEQGIKRRLISCHSSKDNWEERKWQGHMIVEVMCCVQSTKLSLHLILCYILDVLKSNHLCKVLLSYVFGARVHAVQISTSCYQRQTLKFQKSPHVSVKCAIISRL